MAGDTNAVAQQHRTLLLENGWGSKVDLSKSVIRPYDPRDKGGPIMGAPSPTQARPGTQRGFWGRVYKGGSFAPAFVREWDGQQFANYATAWEKVWSVLCPGNEKRIMPVVNETGWVVGHFGEVSGTYLVTLPWGSGKRTFVVSNETQLYLRKVYPDNGGGVVMSVGFTDMTYDVLTALDGEVLLQSGGRERAGAEAEAISIVDVYLGAKVLVELGVGMGTRLLTALTRRTAGMEAGKLMAGPALAADLKNRAPAAFYDTNYRASVAYANTLRRTAVTLDTAGSGMALNRYTLAQQQRINGFMNGFNEAVRAAQAARGGASVPVAEIETILQRLESIWGGKFGDWLR